LETGGSRVHPAAEGAARLKLRLILLALLALASVAGLGLAACSAPPTAAQTQTVKGVLLEVVSPGIDKVDSFTVRTDDGQELTFVTAPDFNKGVQHLMSPGHMRQHMALADPILVTYRQESDRLVALSATDASP
jgi:hypothetical protein